jgi:HK97 family phage prohead protease
MSEFMDYAAWRAAAARGEAPAAAVRKEASARGQAAGDRSFEFIWSTRTVDRMKDTIDPKGWDLRNYRRNNVVLYGHSYTSLPIARGFPRQERDALAGTIQFPPAGLYPFADQAHDLMAAGYLNAVSVGFRPLTWVYNAERDGYDFLTQELLEVSVVPVPALQEALVAGRADTGAVLKWFGSAHREEDDDAIVLSLADAADDVVLHLVDDEPELYILDDTGRRMSEGEIRREIGRAVVKLVEEKAVGPMLRAAARLRGNRR